MHLWRRLPEERADVGLIARTDSVVDGSTDNRGIAECSSPKIDGYVQADTGDVDGRQEFTRHLSPRAGLRLIPGRPDLQGDMSQPPVGLSLKS